jgi:murein L,D-transpeptidase YafK
VLRSQKTVSTARSLALRALLAFILPAALAFCVSGQQAPVTSARPADQIIILKSERKMMLLREGKVLKTYSVALGTQPVGAKERVGDHKTPEGDYVIDLKKPNSQFRKALHLSYPNSADRARASSLGVSPGGEVEIHGLGSKWGWIGPAHRKLDWTDGCVAVTNEEIDEIFSLVPLGTPVKIKP